MKRKSFVKNICLMAIGGAAGSQLLSACTSLAQLSKYAVEGELKSDGLYVPVSAFGKKEKRLQYIVVHHPKLKFPVCVFSYPNAGYEALWMECTHQGAELQVFGNKLECPAHGSEFNQRGEVESGPAEVNLRKFNTRISKGNLIIQLT